MILSLREIQATIAVVMVIVRIFGMGGLDVVMVIMWIVIREIQAITHINRPSVIRCFYMSSGRLRRL